MKTAYSYMRWSTAGQGATGKDSRKRQSESAEHWMKTYGKDEYILSDMVFIDPGKSGYKGKHIEKDEYGKARGELAKFIELAENGTIKQGSILLIDSFSRFSRLPHAKALNLFLSVINADIGLVFTGSYEKRVINTQLLNKEAYVLQFVIGELIRTHGESAEKSRNVASGIRNRLNGMKNGNVVNHNNVPKYFTFEKDKRQYVHNDNTKIVKQIVADFLAGKSLNKLASELNTRKVSTFRYATEWAGCSIRAILKSRTLIGEFIGIKNYLPAIVDEETFQRVQNILGQNRKSQGREATFINIFRGICFCADCGKRMNVATQRKNYTRKVLLSTPYRYLHCSALGTNGTCKNRKNFRLPDLELEFFCNFLMKNPAGLMNATDNEQLKDINKRVTAAQAELGKITKQIEDAVKLVGIVKVDELQNQLTTLNDRRDNLRRQIDLLNTEKNNVQDAPEIFDDLKQLIGDLGKDSTWETMPDGSRAEYDPTFWKMDEAFARVEETLKDPYVREGIRIMLPPLVGKITVDANAGQFYVYNRVVKLVYTSFEYESNRNNSKVWRDACKNWSKTKKQTTKSD